MNVQAALQAAVDDGKISGAAAYVGNREGAISSLAVGSRDPVNGAAMREDSIFQIFSMTKAITTVAALQLVERGMLSLHTPIGDIVPELADAQVIDGFADDGSAKLRTADKPITLHHLLTHTSGLGYDFISETMMRARGPGGPPPPSSLASLSTPLLFDPGERWEYGISTDWAGRVVEAVSGKSLDAYFAENILEPLAMRDTAFKLNEEQTSRRATPMLVTDDGGYVPFPVDLLGEQPEFLSGGGGLSGTGSDYLRFSRMILNGGTLDGAQVLKPETVAEMTRNQIGTIRAGKMDSVVPMFAVANDMFPHMNPGWSYGFLINPEQGPNGRAAGTLSWAGIANTYYWIDPVNDIAAVLMMQFLPFAHPKAWDVLGAFERAVYARQLS